MISQTTIDEIKERASLIDIVGESVQLKRSGAHFSGLCPFHSEDTPSFHIRENGRSYHCFGCGASGNVISYVMESRGVAFPDAVEELAARYGIEVRREGKRTVDDAPQRDALFKVNQLAFEFYRACLVKADKRVQDYIQSRGLTKHAIDSFGICFAPAQWGALAQHLQAAKVPEDLILATGLVRRNQRGDLFDTFRGRLIFPIWIESRKIAGFGGRLIPALVDAEAQKTSPKYLNSPESPIYQKNKILYGLPQALESARRKKELYLVEGYVDVVGLWQVGVRNAVAPCGTAVSDSHAKRLQHLVERVIVLFDGDQAGRTAAARCFNIFLNSGIEVNAVFLPQDEDPDTIALQHGAETAKYLAELPRTPLIDCYLDNLLQRSGWADARELGSAAKGKIAEEVVRSLTTVRNAIEQDDLIQRAAMKLLVEPEKLAQLLKDKSVVLESAIKTSVGPDADKRTKKSIAELPTLDRELLFAVMAGKERFVDGVLRDPALCEGLDPATLAFVQDFGAILNQAGTHDSDRKDSIRALLQDLGESWLAHWRSAYQMLNDQEVDFELSFAQCRAFVKKSKLKQALSDIDRQVGLISEESEKAVLIREKVALKRQLEGLSGQG